MTDAELLVLLKTDLGISSSAFDSLLSNTISSARTNLQTEGIEIDTNDDMRIVNYSAFLWRNRRSGGEMPKYLRRDINNRLFSQKASEDEDDSSTDDEEE